ncbi:type IV conjugative transfer system protein TraE [Escherichia coli]
MEHGARLSTSRVMAIAFIFMSVLIVLSLSVNVIQGVNNYRLQNEQRTAVTPMAFNAPFAVSQNSADASYLQQMALSFIALRLNVSSETVDASHQALLQYIRPGAQNQMKVILAEEAKRIKNDNVKGLFKQLKEAGVVQRAESFNVANLMPLVADNPLTPAGLLAPTYRNQLAFIDIFFRGMNNTNYNMAVCGTSGAGKTGLIQPLIRSVLDSGGFAVVFDMGDGYKSLCENMGGVYLDGETLRFNPFANITDIDQSAERVRDQLSVMASPNGNLDEVHEGLLLQAVRASWLAKENRARIDDVVDFLKNASDSEQYAESPTIRSRLDEMIVLLDQYTANGTYGQYFNSDEPSLRDDAKMVVLELGGLEDRPSLLVAVMFSLIIYIENRMYRTPRNLKKLNVIDEGWRLLDFKNHKVGEFIEKGYRTARRHTGAYITITQNIVDFDSDKASSAARAAWGNSSYKIILKQSAKEFAKYNQLYPDWRSADYPGF